MKKPRIIGLVLFVVSCIAVYTLLCQGLYQKSRQELNREIEAVLQAVHEAYPEVTEEELIQILQSGGTDIRDAEKSDGKTDSGKMDAGKSFLEKYGYNGDFFYSKAARGQFRRFVVWGGAALILMTGLGVLLFSLYERRRTWQIEGMIRYTQDLADGIYDLQIDANSEDELSRLRNALYKITVLLKESAENSRKESEGLSRSLADISHQIKTPLTSIQIMLDNISDNPEMDPGTRQEFLRLISSQTDRISSLVVTLLQLARFDSGAVRMNPQKTDIGQMVTDVFEELAMLAEVKGVELMQNVEEGTAWQLDRKWQQQALLNIVKNAIEHSPAGDAAGGAPESVGDSKPCPRVTVTAEQNSLFLKLRISDQGEGISREDQLHIFERFYKAKNSTAESIGIGLNFAKTVIEKEGGNISVESVPGEGTTFTIRYYRKPASASVSEKSV